jgi:hypothetical protein
MWRGEGRGGVQLSAAANPSAAMKHAQAFNVRWGRKCSADRPEFVPSIGLWRRPHSVYVLRKCFIVAADF